VREKHCWLTASQPNKAGIDSMVGDACTILLLFGSAKKSLGGRNLQMASCFV
jgi:hypothetical protein